MRAISIPSKAAMAPTPWPKKYTNAFYDFAALFDEAYVLGFNFIEHEKFVLKADIVFVEVTHKIFVRLIEFKKKYPKVKTKFVGFTASLNRLLRVVLPTHWPVIIEGLELLDALGTMNGDMEPMYTSMAPKLADKVFPMPCIIDPSYFNIKCMQAAEVPGKINRHKNFITLSMHSDIHSTYHAKRGDMSTFFIWKKMKAKYPELNGVTWCNHREMDTPIKTKEELVDMNQKFLTSIGAHDIMVKHTSQEFWRWMPKTYICMHLNHFMCQARVSQCCAALGIPIISNNDNETHRRLWPDLAVEWHRHDKAMELFDRLYTDETFYKKMVGKARKNMEYYSPTATKKRIMKAVYGD